MNRILLERDEARAEGLVRLCGRAARHAREVLRAEAGRRVRVGLIDGPTGEAVVVDADDETVTLDMRLDGDTPPRSSVDLILALPRPKVMKRLWAPLAMLGVDRVFLVNAAKVERAYFDTQWIDPAHFRPLLIEGLEQSGDTRLPAVSIHRRLRPFVEDECPVLFADATRLVAHPGQAGGALRAGEGRTVIAVGPEGGWTPFEIELLRASGFARFSLGWRRLRTDIACIALLALAQEARTPRPRAGEAGDRKERT